MTDRSTRQIHARELATVCILLLVKILVCMIINFFISFCMVLQVDVEQWSTNVQSTYRKLIHRI